MATSTERQFEVGDRVRVLKDADSRVAVGTLGTVTNPWKYGFVRVKCDDTSPDPIADNLGGGDGAYPFYEEELEPLFKFKVGDFVRVVSYPGVHSAKVVGRIGEVVGINSEDTTEEKPYDVRFESGIKVSADIVWKTEIFSAAEIERADPKPAETPSKYETLGAELGKLVAVKNAKYGNSHANAGAILRVLYPDGVKPEQYDDMTTIVRILDKLQRIATDKDAFGESPYFDIAGYGLLGAARSGKAVQE